jgi:formyl-CoA transferase
MPGVGTFKCKPGGPDDYVYLIASPGRDRMWQAMLSVLGHEEYLEDPRVADPEKRPELTKEINGMIEAWTMQHTKREAMRILGEAGVPCSACMNAEDIYADPHLKEREMIVTIEHPKRGAFMMPGCPVKLSDSPVQVQPAPLLGQHNAEVYAELLGFDADKLRSLHEQAVI